MPAEQALSRVRSYGIGLGRALVVPVLLVALDAWSLTWLVTDSWADSWLFNLVCASALGWLTFEALLLNVYRIDLEGDEIVLRSVARTRRKLLSELDSIDWGKRWTPTTIRFRPRGRVRVTWHRGLDDFVAAATAASPAFELRERP